MASMCAYIERHILRYIPHENRRREQLLQEDARMPDILRHKYSTFIFRAQRKTRSKYPVRFPTDNIR